MSAEFLVGKKKNYFTKIKVKISRTQTEIRQTVYKTENKQNEV